MPKSSSQFYVNLPRNQALREKIARAIYYGDGYTLWPLDMNDYDVWYDDKGQILNGTEQYYRMADSVINALDQMQKAVSQSTTSRSHNRRKERG